jgi:hypothetical protein
MLLKSQIKRREIQENLANGSYVFLSYYISNTKHIHTIMGGRVTQAKCLHGKYSSRLSDIPTLSAGNLSRRVTRLHHVNSHPGLVALCPNIPYFIIVFCPMPDNFTYLKGESLVR